jgi:hypothetical protein
MGTLRCALALAALLLTTATSPGAWAFQASAATTAVETIALSLGPTVEGVLWRPASEADRKPVGIVVMHESADFTHHPACTDLSARGFHVLCVNGRYVNAAGSIIWDNAALDVKAAVKYLRQQPEIMKVYLLGHSGGGALMSFYENVAENGVAVCQDSRRITPCSSDLADLPRADGVILMDPIPGLAFSQLTYWDPSVTVEDQFGRIDTAALDASLDMFSPDNGYNSQKPSYSDDFLKRFFAAQSERNSRLISLAQSRLEAIRSGQGSFPDDEPFVVNRQAARLWVTDLDLFSHTAQPHMLLTANGQRDAVVNSVRALGTSVRGDISKANLAYSNALTASVRSFLSTYAIRSGPDYQVTADDVTGVDWQSTNTSLIANLGGVNAPLLALSMTGHYWLVTTELGFNASPSLDKTLAYVEGASHGLSTCKACETTPGEFGDTEKTLMDYVAQWLNSHA